MFNNRMGKAFPERAAIEKHNAARRNMSRLDPFGGAFSGDGSNSLSKIIHHDFSVGDRVVVNSPNHEAHGRCGTISDASSDSRMQVQLDSGHTIRASDSDLIPESFLDAPSVEPEKVQKSRIRVGDRIVWRGKHGRVFRYTGATPGATTDDPTRVHICLDGDLLGEGVDVLLSELELEDDATSMDLPGRIHTVPEAHEREVPDVVRTFITELAKGPVTVAADLRGKFEKHEVLRQLIAAGRIRFQDEFFVKDVRALPSL